MEIHFTERAVAEINKYSEHYDKFQGISYLELTIVKPKDEVKHILLDVQEEDWDRIELGDSHLVFTVDKLIPRVLIRKTQFKYFNNIKIDFAEVEDNYIFVFKPSLEDLQKC